MIKRFGDTEEEFENLGFADLGAALALADDLGDIERALVRERAIRKTMAKTGEGREVVAEAIDAIQGMDREAILDLTEGAPTTMIDALTRYIRIVNTGHPEPIDRDELVTDLGAILEHPWPAEEERLASHGVNQSLDLRIEEGDNRDLEIRLGTNQRPVYTVNWEDAGSGGQLAAEGAVRAIYRAVLSRVIADRDHHVQLNRSQTENLIGWLDQARRGGSWISDTRVSVDAVAGGGILIRTRPYAYQHRVAQARADQRRESTYGIRPHRPMTTEDQKRALQYAKEHARPIDSETIRRALDNS